MLALLTFLERRSWGFRIGWFMLQGMVMGLILLLFALWTGIWKEAPTTFSTFDDCSSWSFGMNLPVSILITVAAAVARHLTVDSLQRLRNSINRKTIVKTESGAVFNASFVTIQ